ncbi:hypothetical protein [Rhodopirellula baltica]
MRSSVDWNALPKVILFRLFCVVVLVLSEAVLVIAVDVSMVAPQRTPRHHRISSRDHGKPLSDGDVSSDRATASIESRSTSHRSWTNACADNRGWFRYEYEHRR